MTYELDDGGKRLTEFIGECYKNNYNRSFTTPDDRQALCEKLMETGQWKKFYWWAILKQNIVKENNRRYPGEDIYVYWLLVQNPNRFCWLVSKWLKEKEKP